MIHNTEITKVKEDFCFFGENYKDLSLFFEENESFTPFKENKIHVELMSLDLCSPYIFLSTAVYITLG